MKHKIKILGVAPYHGLLSLMEQAAALREDVELTAIYGNLEDGAKAALSVASGYDVIISRANTANLINQSAVCPVVDLGISYYDVLRCIKQAEASGNRFAILGFHRLAGTARSLCELMRYEIEIFSISSSGDISALLSQIKEKGYRTVVCDTVPYAQAKLMGITPILMTSGVESVKEAFNQAVELCRKSELRTAEISMLQNVIESERSFSVVMEEDGRIAAAFNRVPESEQIIEKLRAAVAGCDKADRSFFVTVRQKLYAVSMAYFPREEKPYIVCHVRPSGIPLTHSKNGITILDKEQAQDLLLNSFFLSTAAYQSLLSACESLNRRGENVMIAGEVGTGKDKAAYFLYAASALASRPLYAVNCSLLNDRSWSFLTASCHSPFTDNGNTIYISNVNDLSDERQRQLLSIFVDTNLHVRNRVIFSCHCQAGEPAPHQAMRFVNLLNCPLLPMAPLRELSGDIPSSACLYLDTLNQELARQVAGFTPEALTLLQSYSWPLNQTQLKRVLRQIVLTTDCAYVPAEAVRRVLELESLLVSPSPATGGGASLAEDGGGAEILGLAKRDGGGAKPLDLTKTLDEINREIVRLTLDRCGGNHTKAAKQLGISRTTLWRYLSDK